MNLNLQLLGKAKTLDVPIIITNNTAGITKQSNTTSDSDDEEDDEPMLSGSAVEQKEGGGNGSLDVDPFNKSSGGNSGKLSKLDFRGLSLDSAYASEQNSNNGGSNSSIGGAGTTSYQQFLTPPISINLMGGLSTNPNQPIININADFSISTDKTSKTTNKSSSGSRPSLPPKEDQRQP